MLRASRRRVTLKALSPAPIAVRSYSPRSLKGNAAIVGKGFYRAARHCRQQWTTSL